VEESQLVSELSAALDDEAATIRAPAGAAERARRRARAQRLRRGLVATVSAAGLAVGLMVAVSGAQAPAGQRGHGAGMVAHLTAVGVLDRAAASALAQPTTIPRPDQFVYWNMVNSGYGTTETWRSVDGSRNGFALSGGKKVMLWGCHDGWQTVRPDPGSRLKSITQRCAADPAYLPDMPISASGMPSYLARKFGVGLRDAPVAQKVTEVLLDQNYLLPAQRAALYRFFVTLPGLKVVPRVRDYIGRPGVGVSLTTDGFTAMWIFDPKTFAYLGSADLVGRKLSFGSAVVKVAIVDKVGQRP
jgi:hypothetical protein